MMNCFQSFQNQTLSSTVFTDLFLLFGNIFVNETWPHMEWIRQPLTAMFGALFVASYEVVQTSNLLQVCLAHSLLNHLEP